MKLTKRQRQVYELLVERGYSNKEIARELNLCEPTVALHVQCVFRALGARSRAKLIVDYWRRKVGA